MNYGGPAGCETLIAAVRRWLVANRVGGLTDETLADRRIIIGPNGATSLLESVAYVLPRGIVVISFHSLSRKAGSLTGNTLNPLLSRTYA